MRKREISLNEEEREQLNTLTRRGVARVRKTDRARILLLADTNGEHLRDTEIAKVLGIASTTVWRSKRLYAEQGLEAALGYAQAVRFKPRKLDGRGEARLIALACSEAPMGHAKWSLRMLADKLVELEVVSTISHETVRQTLKKTNCRPI
jgi:transposase